MGNLGVSDVLSAALLGYGCRGTRNKSPPAEMWRNVFAGAGTAGGVNAKALATINVAACRGGDSGLLLESVPARE